MLCREAFLGHRNTSVLVSVERLKT